MYLKPCSANQCLLQSVLCMTRHNFHAIFFNILYITIYVGAKSGVAGTAGISPYRDSVLVSD